MREIERVHVPGGKTFELSKDHEASSLPKIGPMNLAHICFCLKFDRTFMETTKLSKWKPSFQVYLLADDNSSARITLLANKRTDAQLSQTIYTRQPTCSTIILLHDGSILYLPFLHAIATHAINLLMLGRFLKDMLACPYVCTGKIACPQKLPRKSPRTHHKLRHNFLEMRETLHARAVIIVGMFVGTFVDPFADLFTTSAARTTCRWCAWRGFVGGTTGYASEQTHTTQWKYWKAPSTKPRAHAVSHGQTTGGGVWLRPFLVWHAAWFKNTQKTFEKMRQKMVSHRVCGLGRVSVPKKQKTKTQ